MKKNILITLLAVMPVFCFAQQVYNDFEDNGVRHHTFSFSSGVLDTSAVNIDKDGINTSDHCALYVRNDSVQYDVIHMFMKIKLSDVTPYASLDSLAPRITLKMYSRAPAGTPVDLQLGLKNNTTYPSGVHSNYKSVTTVEDEWEELVFDFFEIPLGSMASATDIDRITLLINPAPAIISSDTFYFDDLTGPEIFNAGLATYQAEGELNLDQNYPNPAGDKTSISFVIKENAEIKLEMFDLSGKGMATFASGNYLAGKHIIKADLSDLPSGVYIYRLQSKESVITRKMIINNIGQQKNR